MSRQVIKKGWNHAWKWLLVYKNRKSYLKLNQWLPKDLIQKLHVLWRHEYVKLCLCTLLIFWGVNILMSIIAIVFEVSQHFCKHKDKSNLKTSWELKTVIERPLVIAPSLTKKKKVYLKVQYKKIYCLFILKSLWCNSSDVRWNESPHP